MRPIFVSAAVIAIIVIVACTDDASSSSGGASPPLTEYDQTCAKDEDCAVVFTGPTCSCSCQVGGVNQKDRARYVADRNKVTCANQPDCAGCASVRALCTGGRCATETCPGVCSPKDASTD
jgi:hypothetical protein